MIKKVSFLFFFVFFSFLLTQEDFIDDLEYGKKLYEKPRGIGCRECHGDKGEGKLIAIYRSKGKAKKLFAPQISNLTLQDFAKNINQGKGVMPKYYLTQKEILAIYKFLKN